MNKIFKTLCSIGILFFIPLYANRYVDAEILRTLKQGDRGADVKELQVFLNSDPDTRIAVSGVGSVGYESTYFGALTALAVKKLQIKYAYDTLTPAGLSTPTGVVGAYTRALIYKVVQAQLFATPMVGTPPSSTNTAVPNILSITPSVISRSPQTLTITGTGFTPTGNTIIISSEAEGGITNISSPDGKTITVPFTFSGAQKARTQLAPYQSSSMYTAIKSSYIANISETVLMQGIHTIPVTLTVKNANGESAARTLYINLAGML